MHGFWPLDLDEHRLSWEPADNLTPDKIFEKRWADVTLRRAIRALRREYEVSGHREQFDALKGCLTGDRAAESYREIGSQLGMSEGAVKVAVHRMRLRFGDLLRGEIAHTVADLSEVDDELRYLISIMSF